jgi:hypothetical protein
MAGNAFGGSCAHRAFAELNNDSISLPIRAMSDPSRQGGCGNDSAENFSLSTRKKRNCDGAGIGAIHELVGKGWWK